VSALEERLALEMRHYRIPEPVRQAQIVPGRKFRFDFAWPDHKLAVEINGGEFTQGAHNRSWGQRRDNEKSRLAQQLGWRVWTFTGSQVRDATAIDTIRVEFHG
jgi:very-short-patch-repair endonuclease